MPLIITPGQLERRAELYHQLGILIAAGMTMHQALGQLKEHPPSRSLQPAIARWLDFLDQGDTVTGAVRRLGRWMPSFDLALVEAGEQSGRLDACFKLLALYYRERAQLVKQTISDLLYPLFILHFGAVLFPFIKLVQTGNFLQYILTVLAILAPLYAVAGFVIFAFQGRHGENWRARVEQVLHRIPLLGVARQDLALARLAAALEALLNAGVPIIGAWELAATASGSPALRRAVQTWRTPMTEGVSTPSELVSACGHFPAVFANLYHTGEISGQLDETLGRLQVLYQGEGVRRMHLVATWAPRMVYFAVLLLGAWWIVTSFYNADIKPLQDIDMHAR